MKAIQHCINVSFTPLIANTNGLAWGIRSPILSTIQTFHDAQHHSCHSEKPIRSIMYYYLRACVWLCVNFESGSSSDSPEYSSSSSSSPRSRGHTPCIYAWWVVLTADEFYMLLQILWNRLDRLYIDVQSRFGCLTACTCSHELFFAGINNLDLQVLPFPCNDWQSHLTSKPVINLMVVEGVTPRGALHDAYVR